MSTPWQSGLELAQLALQGLATPWVVLLVLVLTTFLLEDLAIAAGAAIATQGLLSWGSAFAAVAGGIALGDLGLYALGLGARRVPWLHRRFIAGRPPALREALQGRLASAVLLARVIPGLRLVTYTLCGFAQVRALAFTAWVLLAVSVWTAGLFWLSSLLGQTVAHALGLPAPLAVGLAIVLLALVFPFLRHVRQLLASPSP